MKHWILLAAFLLAINPVTDWLVDRQFKAEHQPTGYTRSEIDGMSRLVERELAKPRSLAVYHPKSKVEAACITADIWNLGRCK